jgi:hypothetical protein
MTIWVTTAVAVIAIAMIALAGRVFAQGAIASITPNFDHAPSFPNMTIVFVAVTDNLPKSDRDIVIQRRATVKPHDVILVRPRALRPERLAQAVATLQAVRRSHGRVPTEDMLIVTDEIPGLNPPRANEAVGWVKSLQSAKTMNMPGVGPVPMIGLHLPDPEIANKP